MARTLWRVWIAAAVILCSLQALTLSVSPVVWDDEVQVMEVGRQILEPDSAWSVVLGPDLAPVRTISYLGGLLHELTYRAAGDTFVAARAVNLLAAWAGSAVLFVWLRQRGAAGWPALVVALLYAIDPGFDRSYRGGRVEALVFLGVLVACWRIAGWPHASPRSRVLRFATAGVLTGILPWLWPAAILLVPLVLVETWRVVVPEAGRVGAAWRKTLWPLVAGGLVGAVLPSIPVWNVAWSLMTATSNHLQWDASSGSNPAAGPGGDTVSMVISAVRYSPFLPILALCGAWLRAQRGLALITFVILGLMVGTRFYLYRYLYVLPYLAPLAAAGLTWLWARPRSDARVRWAFSVSSIAAIAWALTLSFGMRTLVVAQDHRWRNPAELVAVLEREVGRGPMNVCLGSLNVYFAGRALGWQMYAGKLHLSEAMTARLLTQCDVLLVSPDEATPAFAERAERFGFGQGRSVHIGPFPQPAQLRRPRYSGGTYGPYTVFHRVATAPALLRD